MLSAVGPKPAKARSKAVLWIGRVLPRIHCPLRAMFLRRCTLLWVALLASSLIQGAEAQSNVIPGTDIRLGALDTLRSVGKVGNYPFGQSAFAMATTSCNVGAVDVPWLPAMDPDHPMIAFLVTRVDADEGRLVQISDYSHLKHGFFATSQNLCSACLNPSDGTYLGVGCSDTYTVFNNADSFWLGPAQEVDPWTGAWDPVCSFFDAGLNPVPPFDCDGLRSLSAAQAGVLGELANRVIINDAELSFSDASYFYASQYVVPGEPEAARLDSLGHRGFAPQFDPLSVGGWLIQDTTGLAYGSVLDRWPGALVSSVVNGNDDGRVYVAAKVTGPDEQGLFHYEYAVHNRDSARGVGALEWPICADAPTGFGFRDVDLSLANQWSTTVNPGSLRFETSDNPLRWNSIYNFWFDSPTPPELGTLQMEPFAAGAGASSLDLQTWVPAGAYSETVAGGCTEYGQVAQLGANDKPSLGNVGMQIALASGAPGGTPALLYGSGLVADLPLGGGCNLILGGALGPNIVSLGLSAVDTGGAAVFATPVPNDVSLEGVGYRAQALLLTGTASAPLAGIGELSAGLALVLGSQPVLCP